MGTSQITGMSAVCSTFCSRYYLRKYEDPTLLAFRKGIHRSRADSHHKRQVMWKAFHVIIIMRTVIHYNDVIMSSIASQITSVTIVYSTVYSDTYQRKHQSSASLAFVWGIHRWPVNSPHKGPVTRKMFPFDDVIMNLGTRAGGMLLFAYR